MKLQRGLALCCLGSTVASVTPSPKSVAAAAAHALAWAEECPTDSSSSSFVSSLTFDDVPAVSDGAAGSPVRTLPSRRLAVRLSGVQEQVTQLRARIARVTGPDSFFESEGSLSYSVSSGNSRNSDSDDDVWMPKIRVEATASKPVAPLNLVEAARKHDESKHADMQAARNVSLGYTENVRDMLFAVLACSGIIMPLRGVHCLRHLPECCMRFKLGSIATLM